MALISKENTFKNRCIDVVNQGELMCLSFAPLDSLSSDYLDDPIDIIEMSKTEESKEVGDGFVIFYVRHNLNTGYTEIEWSNRLEKFYLETPIDYMMSLKKIR